jgi:hypothetical protein
MKPVARLKDCSGSSYLDTVVAIGDVARVEIAHAAAWSESGNLRSGWVSSSYSWRPIDRRGAWSTRRSKDDPTGRPSRGSQVVDPALVSERAVVARGFPPGVEARAGV